MITANFSCRECVVPGAVRSNYVGRSGSHYLKQIIPDMATLKASSRTCRFHVLLISQSTLVITAENCLRINLRASFVFDQIASFQIFRGLGVIHAPRVLLGRSLRGLNFLYRPIQISVPGDVLLLFLIYCFLQGCRNDVKYIRHNRIPI